MASEPLSTKQIELVRNSWDIIKKDGKTFGNQLFIGFFTKYPPYQQFFKSFANIPLSELGSSKRLLAHTTNVMYSITALVDSLDDTECLIEMLVKAGNNHFRRKLTIEMFDQLGVVFIDLLRSTLGPDQFNEQLLNAWSKTYSIIVEQIKVGFK